MATDRREEDKHRALRQQASLNPRPDAVAHPLFRDRGFFDPHDLLQVKYEMLRAVRVDKQSISEAARAFGFSRPSFYQAQTAFEQGGLAALIPQKTGPRNGHKLTPAVMEAEPTVRAERLASLVHQTFGVQVHPRSIERQFLRQKKP
jgi:transposase